MIFNFQGWKKIDPQKSMQLRWPTSTNKNLKIHMCNISKNKNSKIHSNDNNFTRNYNKITIEHKLSSCKGEIVCLLCARIIVHPCHIARPQWLHINS